MAPFPRREKRTFRVGWNATLQCTSSGAQLSNFRYSRIGPFPVFAVTWHFTPLEKCVSRDGEEVPLKSPIYTETDSWRQ